MSKKINVVVEYVGQNNFSEEIPPETSIQAVKVRAMHFFQLDPGSAGKYVLQYNGSDIEESRHVGDFGTSTVVLTLTLKNEVNKG